MAKKTLSLKSNLDVVATEGGKVSLQTYSSAQLVEMLKDAQKAEGVIPTDTTVDLPTGEIPKELIADKSALPPVDKRAIGAVQPPPYVTVNGDPRMLAGMVAPLAPPPSGPVDPRTGSPFNQVIPPRLGGMISPPPTRNFK